MFVQLLKTLNRSSIRKHNKQKHLFFYQKSYVSRIVIYCSIVCILNVSKQTWRLMYYNSQPLYFTLNPYIIIVLIKTSCDFYPLIAWKITLFKVGNHKLIIFYLQQGKKCSNKIVYNKFKTLRWWGTESELCKNSSPSLL